MFLKYEEINNAIVQDKLSEVNNLVERNLDPARSIFSNLPASVRENERLLCGVVDLGKLILKQNDLESLSSQIFMNLIKYAINKWSIETSIETYKGDLLNPLSLILSLADQIQSCDTNLSSQLQKIITSLVPDCVSKTKNYKKSIKIFKGFDIIGNNWSTATMPSFDTKYITISYLELVLKYYDRMPEPFIEILRLNPSISHITRLDQLKKILKINAVLNSETKMQNLIRWQREILESKSSDEIKMLAEIKIEAMSPKGYEYNYAEKLELNNAVLSARSWSTRETSDKALSLIDAYMFITNPHHPTTESNKLIALRLCSVQLETRNNIIKSMKLPIVGPEKIPCDQIYKFCDFREICNLRLADPHLALDSLTTVGYVNATEVLSSDESP